MHRTIARHFMAAFMLPGGIRLEIANQSITRQSVACIVNAAKRSLEGGGGVDGVIHAAAGSGLLRACKALPFEDRGGVRCRTGNAKLTVGPFATSLAAPNVIHVVGPDLREGHSLEDAQTLLKSAISTALALADSAGYSSIAIPAVSCGVYSAGVREWMTAAPGYILRSCVEFGEATVATSTTAVATGSGATGGSLNLVRIVLTDVNAEYCVAWKQAAVELGLPELADTGLRSSGGGVASSLSSSQSSAAAAGAASAAGSSAAYSMADAAVPAVSAAATDTASSTAGIRVAFDLPTAAGRGTASGQLCRFLAIGDWGAHDPSSTRHLAANMAAWVRAEGAPDFVLALGDNFYPSGVTSVRCVLRRGHWWWMEGLGTAVGL